VHGGFVVLVEERIVPESHVEGRLQVFIGRDETRRSPDGQPEPQSGGQTAFRSQPLEPVLQDFGYPASRNRVHRPVLELDVDWFVDQPQALDRLSIDDNVAARLLYVRGGAPT
jgi:hypothetical protein